MLKINPISIIGTKRQKEELRYALGADQAIVNSSVFSDELLKTNLTETGGLTNKEVLKKLRQEININFEFSYDYKKTSTTLGGYNERLNRIRINAYRWYGLRNQVAVITHEYSHKWFDHSDQFQHQSVPYAAEKIAKGIIDKHGYKEGKKLRNLSPKFLRWLFNWVVWL